MSVASRVRRFGAKVEQAGICLDEREPWCVSPSTDAKRFVRALPLVAPDGAFAYFEGTADPRAAAFLGRLAIEPTVQVAVTTDWPRPDFYHLPLSQGLMEALARFLEESQVGRLCTHVLVYRDSTVLLQARNAFAGFPMHLSRAFPVDAVRAFAAAIGSTIR
jgi:hypothetical protein